MPAYESHPERARSDSASLEAFRRLVIEASDRFAPEPACPVDPGRDLRQAEFWQDQAGLAAGDVLLDALCRASQAYWMGHAALEIDALRRRTSGLPRSPHIDQRLAALRDTDPALVEAVTAQWEGHDTAQLHAAAAELLAGALRDCRSRDTPLARRAVDLVEQAGDDLDDWREAVLDNPLDEPEDAELRPEVSAAVEMMLRRCFVTAMVDQVTRREGLGSVPVERDAANNIALLKREKVAPSAAELAFEAARRAGTDA